MSVRSQASRGRGAASNPTGRFEALQIESFDDGWREQDPKPVALTTQVQVERAKTIINKNDSPDLPFGLSINPYRGCEHGCIYCYARPAHAFMGLSPGLDFESKLFFKPGAAALFEKELSKPQYKPEVIHIGANTDPYQPIERRLKVTRGLILTAQRFHQPISLITKGALIVRDLDLLAPMATENLIRVAISITTLDRPLARAMEPRAATPERRLEAVSRLAQAGVPVTVMAAPLIPGLNDHELEAILERAAEAGASGAGYVVLRLPLEVRDLFQGWLKDNRPDRADRVMSLVRQMRGGRDYDARWRTRMSGEGPLAKLIAQRFKAACRRYGLNTERPALDASRFRSPDPASSQLDLFAA
jgi:DNA repair photolyase